ncbi:putative signal peptide protein [Blattamonas nauphoetae]|uniref:Signal peptide protein n=1 Tax=Blattamonas nauphoetae TaxID=2049346 RepID=A0ABQ9XDJ1_9EUKA|nr:putative signal peptide protein [Blattamonas nauphoetae]
MISALLCLVAVTAPIGVRYDHPQKLPIEALSIQTADTRLDFEVEVAESYMDRIIGLMWRKHIEDNEGMIFIFPKKDKLSFWMRNTLVSLDVLYIDDDGKIVTIHENSEPLSEVPRGTDTPCRIALELKGGTCAAMGIHIGDYVTSDSLIKLGIGKKPADSASETP